MDTIDLIIGLTNQDISTSKYDENRKIKLPVSKYSDWGILGLGYRPGVSCVVSTYRIKHPNYEKFIDRFQKIAMHEIGHNMGLIHCTKSENCVMRDAAEKISTVDNVQLKLCPSCLKQISSK